MLRWSCPARSDRLSPPRPAHHILLLNVLHTLTHNRRTQLPAVKPRAPGTPSVFLPRKAVLPAPGAAAAVAEATDEMGEPWPLVTTTVVAVVAGPVIETEI